MKYETLLEISLSLFDGGSAAGDGGTADTGAQGEAQALPGPTRRGKAAGEFQNVVFGKNAPTAGEEPAQPSDAGKESPEVQTTSHTLEERRKAFQDLVNGEYKDVYTQETQRIIDRRFRETKDLEAQAGRNQPVIDMLLQRYKIADGDVSKLTAAIEHDDAYWSGAAEEAGMSVDQYRQFQKLQRENAALLQAQNRRQGREAAQQQLQKWYAEAEQVQTRYPGFDLNTEVGDPQFLSMLKAGVPVQHAYEVLHMDDILAGVAQSAAKQTEKQVVDGIRAKGARPPENGTAQQSAFTMKDDVSKLSRKDRAEIARRVARGEQITF